MPTNELIFVQIASYRDPDLVATIKDLLVKSRHPENFTFGICWQRDETESLDEFVNDLRFRIKEYHYTQSQGLGWARNITNSLYKGEKYTLQLDSHHRFVQDWDVMLLEDYNQALTQSKKPIISTYCTPFDTKLPTDQASQVPCLMSQYEFSNDKLLMSRPSYISEYKTKTHVIKARTISGHFFFVDGKFIEEVQYDPDIYFGGYTEETTMSVRAFTNGYDFYSPHRMLFWHEYTRAYRPKHWEDHGIKSETKKTSGERDIYARNKTRQLFGQDEYSIDMGIYGLGTERTLHDYEVYGGFNFKKCLIQEFTLLVKEPPNPPDWEEQFKKTRKKMKVEWDVSHFKAEDIGDYQFITLGVVDKFDTNLFRIDFKPDTHPEIFKYEQNSIEAEIMGDHPAERLIMYAFSKKNEWSKRYEKKL
jgi:glycosyltransferase involved in cell wall biosynthesis